MKSYKEWLKNVKSGSAPVKEPEKKPIRTPSKPQPEKEDEWSPKPSIVPQPKNRKISTFKEDYERDVHHSTKEFWNNIRNKKHVFSKHPLMAQYGNELSRKSWDHLQPGEESNDVRQNMVKCMQYIQRVEEIESKHKEQLETLAVELTEKLWGIPSERLDANLTGLSGNFDKNLESDPDYDDNEDLDDELRGQVNKRITMNLLVHGSSMHTLKTAHAGARLMDRGNVERYIDRELSKIDPMLVRLYNKIAEITGKQFWLIDINMMMAIGLSKAAVGSSRVDYNGEKPKVIARGLIFPFLVHELFKGTAELLSHYGLEDLSKDTARKVINKADDIRHEPYLAMTGPALWRKILKIKPVEMTLAQIMKAFSKMSPKEMHDFLSKVWESNLDDRDELEKLKQEFLVVLDQK